MQRQTTTGQVQVASGLNALVGLWEIAAPFVLTYSAIAAATTNDVIVGVIVAVLAAIRVFWAYGAAWLSWVNVVLGVWLIIAPFVLTYSGTPMTNDIIVGIIIAVLGTWSALATRGATS